MSIFWKRTLAITTITAAATLGLTECGDGAAEKAPSTEQSTETQKTESTQLTEEDFAERIGAAQIAAGSVHNEVTMTANGQSTMMSGDVQLSDDPSALKMSMSMSAPSAMQIVVVDSMLYMNMGEMTQNKFVATDLNSPEAGQYASMISQSNPQKQMELFSEALTDFEVSDETVEVDGVETYEYTLTLDTATLLSGQGVPTEGAELPETMTYVMNVGADDLPRRFVMDLQGTTAESNFTKWGEPVSIEAPSADQIVEM
ncbi:hypothetical protein [Leucobacter denitrificans]|uniref:LppX_LprAFG lipoprotein n=1 Tax=Leucobacter denitrificans TaxID=683042 RepID=A0A7G9S6Z5_9MICO|nr:hypothetical protein [Leucobacter denitrificans]QNN63620.1 hypothetical protein H9L06_04750 [Leucobacter denitrificans]